jgi:hypothetical protein
MIDRKDVIGNPNHVWGISVEQPLNLIHHLDRITAAVRLPKDLMAAPIAAKRATSGGNEIYRAATVMRAPGLDITLNVDRISRRPWLLIKIFDLATRGHLTHLPVLIEKC